MLWLAIISLGWSCDTHHKIVEDAIELMPEDFKGELIANKESLLRGSIAPDTEYLNFFEHNYNIYNGIGGAPSAINREAKLICKMIRENKPFDKIAYRLGVISHYVSDLHVPLHTDETDPNEWKYHTKYENEVVTYYLFRDRNYEYPPLELIDDPEEFAISIALFYNQYYDDISKAYTSGGGFSKVRKLTEKAYRGSVYDVACIWHTLLTTCKD